MTGGRERGRGRVVAATVVALFVALASCKGASTSSGGADAGPCLGQDFAGSPLGVRCGALVDAQGREVLLHGVNARVRGIFDVTFDDGRVPLEAIPTFGDADAKRLRELGYDALRLPLDWSGIEPTETGGFDEGYLDRVAAVVDACRAHGVLVLLDLHQDGYSKEIGEDGAPLWAIVPPPTQELQGPLTDLSQRILSKQVQEAYATFYGSSPDGARLRDRYTRMAAHVLARFAEDDAVVGLELQNEPLASDTLVRALHEGMIAALRPVAPKKLLFFEPSAFRNLADVAPPGDGSLGAGTVYAPHVYTLVFAGDQASRDGATKDRLRRSNASARDEADGWLAPLVVTEFGFDPHDANFPKFMRFQQELQDEFRASSFLWVWKETGGWGLFDLDPQAEVVAERPTTESALARVRLEAAAGRIVSVGYDADAKRFQLDLAGDAAITAPNLVSLGDVAGFDAPVVTCDGHEVSVERTEPLQIPCGGAGAHTLVVAAHH